MASNKGLGKGLGALLGDFQEAVPEESNYRTVQLHRIEPNPDQPRKDFDEVELQALADVILETDAIVLSDEIYSELTYGRRHVSIATLPGMKERTILINGFSKAFAMTGWRLGYAMGPCEIMNMITKIHQFAIMCAPTTSQYAAVEALRHCDEEVEKMLEEYDMRRKIMVSGFNKLGLECREPKGAFYAFPCIKSTGLTSEEFCERLLEEYNVAIVPGTAFGPGGEGFMRLNVGTSRAVLKDALERLRSVIP